MLTVENVFPVACPKCRHFEGMPFKSETIADGAVLVALRCRACVYEWDIEMAEGMVLIAPKRDRRRTLDARRGVKILPAQ
jgi:hypothetical protein